MLGAMRVNQGVGLGPTSFVLATSIVKAVESWYNIKHEERCLSIIGRIAAFAVKNFTRR
jgi:hypothetical protein